MIIADDGLRQEIFMSNHRLFVKKPAMKLKQMLKVANLLGHMPQL